ncbi:hypothetical protein BH20ACI4_BH20ACI4_28790 [soil metagenome]
MYKFARIFLGLVFAVFMTSTVFSATFTVTKTSDSNDGTCDADCSLREAVTAANNAAGDDIINFDATVFGTTQTVNVTLGEIIIGASGTLTINGTGANMLTIDGNLTNRIFRTGAGVVATINDATITRGNGVGALATGSAGAIYNDLGTLTLNNLIITGNSVTNNAGGIRNSGTGSVLTINNCIVSNNTAGSSSGGGMQNFSTSTVFINNSTFMGNTSGGSTGGGGGQFNGTARITNSTFANNNSPGGGGGGLQSNGSSMIITNSTFSGNTSTNNGGGIHRGTTNVNFFIRNSIVAGNNGTAASPDVTNSTGGLDSQGNNIIGNVGTSTGWEMSDLLNTNPMLGMLADNGGFGMTFLPMSGSPAIDAGQNCVLDLSCASNNPPQAVTTDQRGVARPQGAAVDIGAVEVASMQTNATVSGKVLSPEGYAVSGVLVTISNGKGIIQSVVTNNFGNFVFTDIPTGQMYSLDVLSKQYEFTPQNVTVNGNVTGVTIMAGSENLKK